MLQRKYIQTRARPARSDLSGCRPCPLSFPEKRLFAVTCGSGARVASGGYSNVPVGNIPILKLSFAEIATVKWIRIYFVFPVFVMFRYIFTNSQLLKSADLFKVFNLQFKRQMLIATLFESIFRIVNIEPLFYSGVHS